MSLIANEISYIHPNGEALFMNVSFSLASGQKAALIGHNGAGKSTLARILAGQINPTTGDMQSADPGWYVPQHFGQFDQKTVAEALGVSEKICALRAVLSGDANENYFDTLQDDWGIEERVSEAMAMWRLEHLNPEQPMTKLSGGEKTRVFLAGIAIHDPAVILLDEPTNYLDMAGRELLYTTLRKTRATILVISHDRSLLNEVGQILELEAGAMHAYGGNYAFYREQKDIALTALKHRVDDSEKQLRQAKIKANALVQQRQKQESRGKKEAEKKSLPRILAGARKNQAEMSTARLHDVHQDKMDDLSSNLSQARAALYARTDIKIALPDPGVPDGKMLLEAERVIFQYSEMPVWSHPLSFSIRAGERVRIAGANGSGKTTLLRMITGELTPSTGKIWKAEMSILLLDQEYSMVDRSLTVIDQAQKFNRTGGEEHVVKMMLNRYQFTKEMWDSSCSTLSGGELMKLAFCCLTVSVQVTDMLILDEPTNNLDLKSQEILAAVVRDFKGAVVVISHDQAFLDEIGLEREILLGSPH